MHVFLAGATGVLGRRLLPLLYAGGHQVTALTRDDGRAAGIRAWGGVPVVGDVYDRDGLARIVRDAAPDLVMHQLTDLSGGSSDANARMRVTGTRNLVDAAHAAGVRRIVAQSIAWAYEGGSDPADETTPLDVNAPAPRRTTIDGVLALENAARALPEWVVLRYGLLYGHDTWYTPGGLMATSAHAGKIVAGDDVSSFVHVDDAATAAVQSLDWPSGTTVNIVDDEPAAAREWAPAFCRSVGAPPPPSAPPRARAPWARGADNHYARDHLTWHPAHPTWRPTFSTR